MFYYVHYKTYIKTNLKRDEINTTLNFLFNLSMAQKILSRICVGRIVCVPSHTGNHCPIVLTMLPK